MVKMEFNNKKMSNVTKISDKSGNNVHATIKKPFDKKKYREEKYSNKHKIQVWDNKRKTVLLQELTDMLLKKRGVFVKASSPEDFMRRHLENASKDPMTMNSNKPKSVLAMRLEYKRRQQELQRKKDDILKAKAEKREAIKKYKQRKADTYKVLSKKTKKGQPVMKDRLELLLAKIQLST